MHEIRPYQGLSEVTVVSLAKTHLGMVQGSKGQILPCCIIRLLLDYLLSPLSVKHIHYLHKAYVRLEFCLSHFLSGGPLIPRGLLLLLPLLFCTKKLVFGSHIYNIKIKIDYLHH